MVKFFALFLLKIINKLFEKTVCYLRKITKNIYLLDLLCLLETEMKE